MCVLCRGPLYRHPTRTHVLPPNTPKLPSTPPTDNPVSNCQASLTLLQACLHVSLYGCTSTQAPAMRWVTTLVPCADVRHSGSFAASKRWGGGPVLENYSGIRMSPTRPTLPSWECSDRTLFWGCKGQYWNEMGH